MAEIGNYQAPADVAKYRTLSLGVGVIALIVWAVGLYFQPEQALLSWLLGFIFWGGITIGGLGVLMLQYMSGGAWGVVIRRVAEAASRGLPLVIILFSPLAIGVFTHPVYGFTHLPAHDPTVIQRRGLMTSESWILLSVGCFIVFGIMPYLLNKWGGEQDKAADHGAAARLVSTSSRFSGPATVIYCLIISFASVDWVMILD